MAKAYWYENNNWIEGHAEDRLDAGCRVTALVGGGGKTTMMRYLAGKYAGQGLRTAVTTTTKIGTPDLLCGSAEDCLNQWEAGCYAVCGQPFNEMKIQEPSHEMCLWLERNADVILTEADGACHMPCKAPDAHEPVIPDNAHRVIGLMGIDALGQRIRRSCFRPERVCELLGCDPEHILTAEDMAEILLSEQGTAKGAAGRDYWVVINKCDDSARLAAGQHIAELLREKGHYNTMLTTFR